MPSVAVIMRSSTLLLVAACLSSTLGCKILERFEGRSDERGTPEPKAAGQDPKSAAGGGKGCTPPSTVNDDFTVQADCKVDVKGNLLVRDGATLTIEEGATLAFDQGRYLQVDKGKLIVRGTEKKPVLLTSAASTKAAGDWVGILFEDGTIAGTELEWVTIEYAGADKSGGRGALTLRQRAPKRISVRHATLRDSELAGVGSDSDKGTFDAFEDNVLEHNKHAVRAPLDILGSMGKDNRFGDPIGTWGDVDEAVTLPSFGVPVIVERNITVGSRGAPAKLAIAPKTVMKFGGGRYLQVGTQNGGSLSAPGVVFTSASDAPQPGDWAGIFLERSATNVDLKGATVEYAGKGSGARGGITVRAKSADLAGLEASGMTFRNNVTAAVATQDKDCAPFAQGSSSIGAPLCRMN